MYLSKLDIFAIRFTEYINLRYNLMNIPIKKLIFLSFMISLFACKAPAGNENTVVSIKTTLGDIKVQLYDSTPGHRDNFIKLVNSGIYDGVIFHRVIQDFMIQAGDTKTKQNQDGKLHDSLTTYTIPAEIISHYYHKKGALAAAREGNEVNPEKRSSGTQFYIVQGTKLSDEELNLTERMINSSLKQSVFKKLTEEVADSARQSGIPLTNGEIQEKASIKMFEYLTSNKEFKIPATHREVYKTAGGVPRLDGSYTVFGEVIEGLEIIDKIAAVPTDESDRPSSPIVIIKMKIEKK